jgi:hypothetical protein
MRDEYRLTTPHGDAVRRAALPEVLLSPDIALLMGGVAASTARRAVLRGEFGPYLRIGRRLALRRESVLEALAAREVHPVRPGASFGGTQP